MDLRTAEGDEEDEEDQRMLALATFSDSEAAAAATASSPVKAAMGPSAAAATAAVVAEGGAALPPRHPPTGLGDVDSAFNRGGAGAPPPAGMTAAGVAGGQAAPHPALQLHSIIHQKPHIQIPPCFGYCDVSSEEYCKVNMAWGWNSAMNAPLSPTGCIKY
jgi:hypothetical protein